MDQEILILRSKSKSLRLSQTGTKEILYTRLSTYLSALKLTELKKICPLGVRKSQKKQDLVKDMIITANSFIFDVVDGIEIIPLPKSIIVTTLGEIEVIKTSKNTEHLETPKIKDKDNVDAKSKDNKQRATIPKILKEQVWKTYVGNSVETKCLVCNDKTISAFDFDCAHIIADKNGGQTTIENLRPTCRSCNLSMATQNMESFCNQFFPNAPVLKTFPSYKKPEENCIVS